MRRLRAIAILPQEPFACFRVTYEALERRGLIKWQEWEQVRNSAYPMRGHAWHVTPKGKVWLRAHGWRSG